MLSPNNIIRKYGLPLTIGLLLIGYQLLRVTTFAAEYGGIEHDGGWMLSISRSLAEQGTYTTMVSTIADPTVAGAVGVDDKFDIQAADGRIWFFTGNGIGPASIVPNALVIALFGTDFWALKAGPLIFYTLFLIFGTLLLYRIAGIGAMLIFHAYLFAYPHLSIFLGYEAMGEVPAMAYVLAAYLTFAWALRSLEADPETRLVYPFLLTGLVISLALSAKLIALWSISGILIWMGVLWLMRRVDFRQLLAVGGGSVSLLLLWEMVHLVVLTWLTNFELYQRHFAQRFRFILDDGSGVGLQIHSGADFYWDKFYLLSEVTHPDEFTTSIIFGFILLGGLVMLWVLRHDLPTMSLVGVMWLGWLANTAWFVGLAKTGWPRHFWFGLILAAMLIAVIVATAFQRISLPSRLPRSDINRRQPLSVSVAKDTFPSILLHVGGRFLALFAVWGMILQPHIWGVWLPDSIVPYWQAKQINNEYDASLPWIIIPTETQAEVVNYIKQMPAEARVYYPSAHKNAEIPAQTGRIHYPLDRREFVTPHPQDVVLIGPSLLSPWMEPVRRADLRRLIDEQCPNPTLANEFYLVCIIEAQQPNLN